MKRVLFLIHDLCHGGAEKVLINLVNNMPPEKFDITVQTLFDVGVHRDKLKPHIHYKTCFRHMLRGNSHLMKLFSSAFLYRTLICEEYDIVISYLEGPPARIISGCPYQSKKVCWLHIELNDKTAVASGFRNYQEAIQCYQKYNRIITVSETVKSVFCRSSDIQPDKIQVLYNTNEATQIQKLAKLPVNDVDFEKDTLSICSVAKITPTKGYDRLARVHKRLILEGLKHHIYILGVGEQQKEIESYLKENALENSFTFLGFRDNPYKYVAKCDLYICSSLREGFSTAVTEALIVGTPVVSTLCSGAKELLGENNEYGLVVENSEEGIYQGIKRMLTEPELLRHYARQTQQRGQYFSTENTVSAVVEMLESL